MSLDNACGGGGILELNESEDYKWEKASLEPLKWRGR